jgi:hypothetical protein
MTSTQKLVAMLSATTAALMIGCSPAPTSNTQAPAANQGSTLPPDQVMRDSRHVMVAGTPMSFDQIAAQLPETLTPAQAAQVLVNIPQSAVSKESMANFHVQVYGRYFFNRGFFGFPFFRNFSTFSYYPFRSYYFPYSYYGGFYRRFSYNNFNYPFFYNYNNCYYPYYYNYGCSSCY